MSSRLSRTCEGILEAGWLAAVILVPLFFNVYSARVFEPDKLTLLRSIALVMVITWLVKVVDGQEWKQWRSLESFWRFPLALPVAVLALVYLITTAVSITPRVSLIGSYQRLQGTYTTLSYIVVFAMMALHLRSKRQVDRLITTVIITSVPIALYGLIQKYGLDPLPWGGDVTTRIASNMGNAIFVSAYIIMVTPLAMSRVVEAFTAILTEDKLAWADVVRASIYIFVVAIHGLAILFSQSRGPLLGFLAGSFIFVLVLLVRLRDSDPSKGRLRARELLYAAGSSLVSCLIGFALVYVIAILATNQGWISADPANYGKLGKISPVAFRAALLGGLGLIGAVVGGVAGIFVMAATRRGWRGLWLSWILLAVLVGGFLALFNLPDSPISDWRNLPYIGRIGTALDLEANTAKVRFYIWEGALKMVLPHEPLEFPDGRKDPFSIIRPLVGYGPESMYVAYNRFYSPELAHHERRNASPDRSHNETFDTLVITGLLGFLSWQALYGSLFFLGFRWLGVIRSKLDQIVFFGLVLGSGLLGAIVFWQWQGPEYIGVAFPFGELGGLLAYLAYYALFAPATEGQQRNPHFVLLTALLAAMAAHFAEIHFGIAIAATRTHFFAYAAITVVLGYVLPQIAATNGDTSISRGNDQPVSEGSLGKAQRKQRRQAPARPATVATRTHWLRPALAGGLIMGLMLGTLGYEFVSNPLQADTQELPRAGEILWNSLTKNPQKEFAPTYATLGLLTITTVLGAALAISESLKSEEVESGQWVKALGVYVGSAVTIGFLFMTFQAGRLYFLSIGAGATPETPTLERIRIAADATTALLSAFYVFVFAMLLLLGGILGSGRLTRPGKQSSGSAAAWITLAGAATAVILAINATNLDLIRADIVYKQADPWDKRAAREGNPDLWQLAIAEYNHALELAPQEDFYYLWLGRAYLEQSAVMDDPVAQQQLMEVAREQLIRARQINPLNTDHSANLARLHTRWAEVASSQVEREAKANQADEYYAQAHSLSPNNAVILNEWAMLRAGLFGDCDGALEKLQQSLDLDELYATTYQNLGNVALTCADGSEDQATREAYYQQAEAAYVAQLEMEPCNLQSHTALGYALSRLNRLDEAIETNLAGLACIANPTSSRTLQFHRNLAILYQQNGDLESAVIHARSAAQAAASNTSALFESAQLLLQLGASEDAYRVAQQIATAPPQAWNSLRDLAILFGQAGHPADGLVYAQQAVSLAPDDQKPGLQDLIATLQGQSTP